MYSPKYAIETERKLIDSVINENPFATVAFIDNGQIQSFHLPLILQGNSLIGHMAKANPAWQLMNGTSILTIFHGPHCYISPDWYGKPGNVPTWNYISIHVKGNVTIVNDEGFLKKAIVDLGNLNNSQFNIEKNIEENQKLLQAIVGIEIQITDIFAKFKLAQSKPEDERINVINHLGKSSNTSEQLMAKAMQESLRK